MSGHRSFAGRTAAAVLLAGAALSTPARAQLVTTMVGRDGMSLPCVTVGPLAPIAQEYCVRRTEAQGAVRKSELGWSGVTMGEGRRVGAVASGSPAAQAGLAAGDLIVSVDGRPSQPSAGETARRMMWGPRGGELTLVVARRGEPLERRFKRGPAPEPADAPHSPNPLVGVHPLMNAHGVFVPCMGAGPLGPVVISACASMAQRKGYVKTDALGETGLSFDPVRTDAAIVTSVAADSPASQADVRPGDQVMSVDGRPVRPDLASDAARMLFGRRGEARRVVADRDGRRVVADLVLAAPPG